MQSQSKYYIFGIIIIAALALVAVLRLPKKAVILPQNSAPTTSSTSVSTTTDATQTSAAQLLPPIADATARVTKKPFGIKVSPGNSRVSPERFSGYHTGIDFETFPNEKNSDVIISAACQGQVLLKKWASGYGGVLVQACEISGQDVTIIYGHLNIASINISVGQTLSAGQKIGVLGQGYSQQTDGERKHLHFGIHKGMAINILGYVQNPADLNNWLDPEKYLPGF